MRAETERFWHTGSSVLLERAAESLESDARVCAAVLFALHHQRGWSIATLAAWLQTTPTQLLRLALSQRPDPLAADFSSAVRRLAHYTGCNVNCLAELLS